MPGASASPLSTPLPAALQVRATPNPQLWLQCVGLCAGGYLGRSNELEASNACWSGQVWLVPLNFHRFNNENDMRLQLR
jgi:hypothetical protein